MMKHAEDMSKPHDHFLEFKVKQFMILPAAIAAIDSGRKQSMEQTKRFDFIRRVGYAEAWENVPLRKTKGNEPLTPSKDSGEKTAPSDGLWEIYCVQNMNFPLYKNNIIFTKASILYKNIYTINKRARLY